MSGDGIFPPYEAFYIDSMLWHTTSASRSIDVVNRWLKLVRDNDTHALELPKAELFEQLQNILHQAGCVSRYLFPSRTQAIHLRRAQRLKQALVVHDDNPLAGRALRDALEHFDERLDKYLSDGRVGQFVPDYVDYEEPESDVPMHIFKAFYTHPLVFVLLGTPYKMAPIVNEMLRIHGVLLQCVEGGYRLPYLEKKR